MIVEHPTARLVRETDGGFELRVERGATLRAVPLAEGWRIDGSDLPEGWSLRRAVDTGSGFLLSTGERPDDEAARTSGMCAGAGEREARSLLTADGRLFRIVLRGPRDGRFELVGWETPGAYLVARPESTGWRIDPTSACGGIDDLRVIAVLFAAEVLDAEEPLVPGVSS